MSLQALQTLQLEASSVSDLVFEDLTGTRVSSNYPVAVYGGHVCTTISSVDSACDHVIEQMPPLQSLGSHFVTAPLVSRWASSGGDIIRVLAAHDGTEVRINGQLVKTLDRGQVHQIRTGPDSYEEIVTSRPALVGQYNRHTADASDASFALLPPVDQLVDRLVLAPPPPLRRNHVAPRVEGGGRSPQDIPLLYGYTDFTNIFAKSSDTGSVRVDGQPLSAQWRAIGDGTYAAARIAAPQGSHVVSGAAPGVKVAALSYGYAWYDTYLITGGVQLAQPPCKPTATVPGDGIDNDCDGVQDEERKNGLDDDGDGVPDEDLALERDPNAPNHAPVLIGSTDSVQPLTPRVKIALPGFDPDGDALSYQVLSAPSPSLGSTTLSGSVLSFTKAAPGALDAQFVVVASDGHLQSAPATFTVRFRNMGACYDAATPTSLPCNEQPYFWGGNFVSQVIKVPPGQLVQFTALAHAFDWDLQSVTYGLRDAPGGSSHDGAQQVRRGDP